MLARTGSLSATAAVTGKVLNRWYRRFGKRCLDLALSLGGLVVVAPALVILALLVWLDVGYPIIFCQMRPGRYGRLFKVRKLRTMHNRRDHQGRLLPDDQRLTPLGRFLRRTSLDELPELINVISGDMSLVGPRPLLTEYLSRYTPEQARRHLVRPGITGWAQVNGRQDLLFSKRLAYDVWYVEHCGFWLDLKILLRTVVGVIRSAGVRNGQDVREVDDLGLSAIDEIGGVGKSQ